MRRHGALAVFAALAFVACGEQIPTLTDADRIPADLIPVTLEHVLGPEEFLLYAIGVRGETDLDDAPGLIVAQDFDGSLNAHSLLKWRPLPDTITFNGPTVDFFFEGAQVRSSVPDTLAVSADQLDFYLWRVTQPWDSTVTWTEAMSDPVSVPWEEPGGTRGELLGIAQWSREADDASADSLVWTLSGNVLDELAAEENPSLMVTLEDANTFAEIGPVDFVFTVRVLEDPDTAIVRTLQRVDQRFIMDQDPPEPDVLRVGGVTSDRSLLHMRLPPTLPGCESGACDPVPLESVTLNRVVLELDPLPVTGGFRPIQNFPIFVRQLLQPELRERAPLGPLIGQLRTTGGDAFSIQMAPPELFLPGNADRSDLRITPLVTNAVQRAESEIGLALVVQPEASLFSYAWFGRTPTLRFVYTLRDPLEIP